MKNKWFYIFSMLMCFIIPIITMFVHNRRIDVLILGHITQILILLVITFFGLLRNRWFESSDRLDQLTEEKIKQKNKYHKAYSFISNKAFEKNVCSVEEIEEYVID